MSAATEVIGPEAGRLARQRSKIVAKALEALSGDELLVLTMRIRGGSSYREIASVLDGVSHTTAIAIERRALAKMRRYFGELGISQSRDLF